jgi:uncharacterized membrane protein YeaQ/YmgE (transglycosylase-associated protein family)
MFHLIRMIIVGFIVGLIARAVVPGADSMKWYMTALLGIVGAFVGGLIHKLVHPASAGEPFHPAGFLLSIIGAVIVILGARALHIAI